LSVRLRLRAELFQHGYEFEQAGERDRSRVLARPNPAVEMALVRVEVEHDTHRMSPLRSASGADRERRR
jgi:hypothetical protein